MEAAHTPETTNIRAIDVALHINHHYKYISFDFILWIIVCNFFHVFHLLLFVCANCVFSCQYVRFDEDTIETTHHLKCREFPFLLLSAHCKIQYSLLDAWSRRTFYSNHTQNRIRKLNKNLNCFPSRCLRFSFFIIVRLFYLVFRFGKKSPDKQCSDVDGIESFAFAKWFSSIVLLPWARRSWYSFAVLRVASLHQLRMVQGTAHQIQIRFWFICISPDKDTYISWIPTAKSPPTIDENRKWFKNQMVHNTSHQRYL